MNDALTLKFQLAKKAKIFALLSTTLAWLFAILLALSLVGALLLLQQTVSAPDNELIVRKVDIALPPPPAPPPPLQIQQSEHNSPSPSINVTGLGGGPTMNFATIPSLGLTNLEKVEQPKFDMNSLSIRQAMSVNFPIIESKNLDKRPRLVSSQYGQFPNSLIKKGIKKVHTKVQIIIDDKGNVYIKKIIDPVYPDMIDVIRNWVKNARFTIPTKNGLPVQAVYDYNLIFEYRI
jgi:periplasmic protein TonB